MKRSITLLILCVCIFGYTNAQWTLGTGMDGGDFRCLTKVGNDIYAGSQYGGVFRSSNNGDSWIPLLNGLPGVVSVTQIMEKDAKLFAGTSYWSVYAKGVYRSDDGGATWVQKNNGIPVVGDNNPSDLSITGLTKCGPYIFAATPIGGVLRSSDYGDTWDDVDGDASNIYGQAQSLGSKGDTLFVNNHRSLDYGVTWTEMFGISGKLMQYIPSGSNLYARSTQGFYWSPSNGDYWITINTGITYLNGTTALSADGNILYASTYDGTEGPKTYQSINGGMAWTNIPAMSSYYVQALLNYGSNAFAGNIGNYGISSNGGGVMRSIDGGSTWANASVGLSGISCTSIATSETDVFAGTKYYSGIFKSAGNGSNWAKSTLPGTTPNYQVLSMLCVNSNIYAGVDPTVYKSADNGQTWASTGAIGSAIYALGANTTYLFAGTSNAGMRRSSDGGTNWTTINTGLPTIGEKSIRAISVNGSKIHIGNTRGVFISTDNGTNWTAANGGVLPGRTAVKSLVVKGDTIVAGGTDVIIRSIDNGVTWTALTTANGTINALLLDGSTIYAGGTLGVFVSSDWGETWTDLNATFPIVSEVYSLNKFNGKLFAGLKGLAVWTYDLAPATKTLNITSLFPEGLYSGSGSLNQANDENGVHWPAGVADQITVELHDAANYATIIYTASAVNLSTTGTASLTIPSTYTGSYFITVKHRNSLQTVSATAKSFAGSTITQSFGTPADVFGGNLVQMTDLGYAIYGGDVNQDGIVDGSDFAMVDNLAAQASSGYLPEDVNGDGLIDGSDFAIIDNIASQAIGAVTP